MFTYTEIKRHEDHKSTSYLVTFHGWKLGKAIVFDSDGSFRFFGEEVQADGSILTMVRDYKNREQFERGGKPY